MENQLIDNRNDFKIRVQTELNSLECPTIHKMEVLDKLRAQIIEAEFNIFKVKVETHLLKM